MKLVIALLFACSTAFAAPTLNLHETTELAGMCLLHRPALAAQQGNPGHQRPPEGWNCGTKENACSCHRECKDVDDTDEFGEPNGKTRTVLKEDANCRVYCFMDHCKCPVHNCD